MHLNVWSRDVKTMTHDTGVALGRILFVLHKDCENVLKFFLWSDFKIFVRIHL
jgi:hypothetical protein